MCKNVKQVEQIAWQFFLVETLCENMAPVKEN